MSSKKKDAQRDLEIPDIPEGATIALLRIHMRILEDKLKRYISREREEDAKYVAQAFKYFDLDPKTATEKKLKNRYINLWHCHY